MISGRFNFINVPQVPAGQPLKAEVDWYGINDEFSAWNPLDPAWKSFMVVDIPVMGIKRVLDDTSELQRDFHRKRTFTLGTMPNNEIAITFSIWAHHKAGYDWNWADYQSYIDWGYASGATPLAFEYRFISPGITPAPPPEPSPEPSKLFSGAITEVTPSQIQAGGALNIYVSYQARTVSLIQAAGWATETIVELDSFKGSDTTMHVGYEGSQTRQIIKLDTMPNRKLSGKVSLYGLKGIYSDYRELLDTRVISVTLATTPVPPPAPTPTPVACRIDEDCPPGYICKDGICVKKEGAIPNLGWIALAALAIIALMPKRKKK